MTDRIQRPSPPPGDHNGRYILGGSDGVTPVPEPDLLKWAMRFEATQRVALTRLPFRGRVSTVFLGLDHSFGHGPPLLFETMTFLGRGEMNGYCDRYSTWDEAEAGHARIVARARRDLWLGIMLFNSIADLVQRTWWRWRSRG